MREPHIRAASKTCSEKTLEAAIPAYYFAFRDRNHQVFQMLGIPRRYAHFVFGVIRAGLTSATAAAIASFPFIADGSFLKRWLESSALSWFLLLPVVLFAAPIIRKLAVFLTREEACLWKLRNRHWPFDEVELSSAA